MNSHGSTVANQEKMYCCVCKQYRTKSSFGFNKKTGEIKKTCDCRLRALKNLENDTTEEICEKIRLQIREANRVRVSKYAKKELLARGFAWCSLCRSAIPVSDFGPAPLTRCRKCNSARVKQNATESSKMRARSQRLMNEYGIDGEWYEKKYESQDGLCGICRKWHPKSWEVKSGGLVVDHCHETGKVRDLLCGRCNNAIGQFKEDKTSLVMAINYLWKHTDSWKK